jgi:replicative DNA helicase
VFNGYASGGTDRARKVFNTLAAADPRHITKMMASADQSAPTAHEWGAVLPFHSIDLPAFPLDIFPDWLREYCEAVTEAMQTPPDLAGMLALSVLSTACARRVGIQAWPGWREPINVYTVTSLPPASRKSPVFRAMMAPLVRFEQVELEKSETAVAEAEARRDILKAQIEGAKRKASNTQGENATKQAFAEVDGLLGELKDMDVPARVKLIVDDVTPEAVATILAEQGGRVSVLSPEGDIFGIMAGRYSAGPPNIGVYLKAHAGETVRIDRKTRSEHIKQAAITIGVTTQPEVMRAFGSNNAFRGQGLLARFFFALPKSTVGSRRSQTEPMSDQVRATYFHRMMMLLENLNSVHSVHSVQDSNSVHSGNDLDHYDSNDISYIEISLEAKNRLKAFMDWIEPQLGDYGALHHLADWAGKLAGGSLRIAGLLHMAETLGQNGRNGQISDNELARAIRLAMYLLPHAQAAYAESAQIQRLMRPKPCCGGLKRPRHAHSPGASVTEACAARCSNLPMIATRHCAYLLTITSFEKLKQPNAAAQVARRVNHTKPTPPFFLDRMDRMAEMRQISRLRSAASTRARRMSRRHSVASKDTTNDNADKRPLHPDRTGYGTQKGVRYARRRVSRRMPVLWRERSLSRVAERYEAGLVVSHV